MRRSPSVCRSPVAALLGHQELGLLVGSGAFTVLYGAGRPARTRSRLLLAVAASLVASVALGSLTTGSAVLGVALVVAVGVVATIACQALRVGVPGAFFFVLAAGLGGYLPLQGVPASTLIAMTAVGAAFAAVVAMADLAFGPRGPQEPRSGRRRAGLARRSLRSVPGGTAPQQAGSGSSWRVDPAGEWVR